MVGEQAAISGLATPTWSRAIANTKVPLHLSRPKLTASKPTSVRRGVHGLHPVSLDAGVSIGPGRTPLHLGL
jgi:hypothetical protein